MRITLLMTALGMALFTAPVAAKEVKTIKARGANAAGACAGALDLLGQYVSRAERATPEQIKEISDARDFFADLPRFDSAEVAAAANAFVEFMVGRLEKATTDAQRNAINGEITKVAGGCFTSAKHEIASQRKLQQQGALPQNPAPVAPLPLDQYETAPLTLDQYEALPK